MALKFVRLAIVFVALYVVIFWALSTAEKLQWKGVCERGGGEDSYNHCRFPMDPNGNPVRKNGLQNSTSQHSPHLC